MKGILHASVFNVTPGSFTLFFRLSFADSVAEMKNNNCDLNLLCTMGKEWIALYTLSSHTVCLSVSVPALLKKDGETPRHLNHLFNTTTLYSVQVSGSLCFHSTMIIYIFSPAGKEETKQKGMHDSECKTDTWTNDWYLTEYEISEEAGICLKVMILIWFRNPPSLYILMPKQRIRCKQLWL